MNKQELREYFKKKNKSRKRCFVNEDIINIIKGKKVLLYHAIFNEIKLDNIVDKLDCNLYYPYAYKNGKMDIRKMDKVIILDEFGIKSYDSKTIDAKELDCIVIPGISFNKKGYRLGYGFGYYDRTFCDFKGLKIGVCYEDDITNVSFENDFDLRVDYIVTEESIYKI